MLALFACYHFHYMLFVLFDYGYNMRVVVTLGEQFSIKVSIIEYSRSVLCNTKLNSQTNHVEKGILFDFIHNWCIIHYRVDVCGNVGPILPQGQTQAAVYIKNIGLCRIGRAAHVARNSGLPSNLLALRRALNLAPRNGSDHLRLVQVSRLTCDWIFVLCADLFCTFDIQVCVWRSSLHEECQDPPQGLNHLFVLVCLLFVFTRSYKVSNDTLVLYIKSCVAFKFDLTINSRKLIGRYHLIKGSYYFIFTIVNREKLCLA